MSDIHTEHSFTTDAAPDHIWAELRRARDEELTASAKPAEWWLPGWTSHCTVLAQTDESLTVRKDDEPCAGTTILVEISHVESGSRIRIVQSGFEPAFVAGAGESFWTHADRIAVDFELFVRHGVLGGRAWRWPKVDLGFTAHDDGAVLMVDAVAPDSWAAGVGLAERDLLLVVAGASLYGPADLQTVQQTLEPGTDVAVTYARGHELHRATAAV